MLKNLNVTEPFLAMAFAAVLAHAYAMTKPFCLYYDIIVCKAKCEISAVQRKYRAHFLTGYSYVAKANGLNPPAFVSAHHLNLRLELACF